MPRFPPRRRHISILFDRRFEIYKESFLIPQFHPCRSPVILHFRRNSRPRDVANLITGEHSPIDRRTETRGSFSDREIKRGGEWDDGGEERRESRMKRHDRHAIRIPEGKSRGWVEGRHYVRPPFGPPLTPNDVPGK